MNQENLDLIVQIKQKNLCLSMKIEKFKNNVNTKQYGHDACP
jgi:hypothetical protein